MPTVLRSVNSRFSKQRSGPTLANSPSMSTEPPIASTAPVMPTTLDPYGQLIKMIMPRAIGIGIYDRDGLPLWISDGLENPDLQELINEAVTACANPDTVNEAQHGLVRDWNGDSAYAFVVNQ